MLIKVIEKQTIFLLKQKEASLTFILLLAVVLGNYITNVLTFRGTDVSQMYQPMKLLALSLNKVYFSANIQLLIVMIYPILVAVPCWFFLYQRTADKRRSIHDLSFREKSLFTK